MKRLDFERRDQLEAPSGQPLRQRWLTRSRAGWLCGVAAVTLLVLAAAAIERGSKDEYPGGDLVGPAIPRCDLRVKNNTGWELYILGTNGPEDDDVGPTIAPGGSTVLEGVPQETPFTYEARLLSGELMAIRRPPICRGRDGVWVIGSQADPPGRVAQSRW